MMKLLLLALVSFIPIKLNDIEINGDDYTLVSEEEQLSEIVDEVDDYCIIKEGNNFYLTNDDKRINLGEAISVAIYKYDKNIVLVINDNKELSLVYFDLGLIKKEEHVLIRNGTISFNSRMSGDYLDIVGTSGEENEETYGIRNLFQNDAFFISFDLKNKTAVTSYYGGATNEGFTGIVRTSSGFFVVGVKDKLGEGDFGNGGDINNILLVKLSDTRRIEKYIILDSKEEVKGFFCDNDTIYLVLGSCYYLIDNNLNVTGCYSFSSPLLATISTNKIIFFLFQNYYYVIDLETNIKTKIEHNFNLSSAKVLSEYIKGAGEKNYRLDLVILSNNIIKYKYNDDKKVDTLFGEIEVLEEHVSPFLDRQVFGTYNYKLEYETKGKINFNINTKYEVPFECNLVSGGVYPTGYHLSFTGKGYLDGNQILSNYQLLDQGDHTLVLKGVDKEVEIKFSVSSKQIEFSDQLARSSDVIVNLGENINLKLNLRLDDSYIIDGVMVNGELISATYDKDKKLLFIPYGKANEVGQMEVVIDKIVYHDNSGSYNMVLYERFIVNVKKPKIELRISDFKEMSLVVDCVDLYKSARFFEVIKKDDRNGEEEVYKFPASSSDILIDNFSDGATYTVSYYLVNDYGGEYLERTLITTLNVEGKGQLNLGKIRVLSYEGSLNRFVIEFDDDFSSNELKEVLVNNQVIFKNERDSLLKYIFFIIIAFVFGLVVPVSIKMIIKKK